ncbi:NADH-quinone oxidoreductase subunit NuoK [Coraliomargarita sinensis]|uniref:NADH-quinone oxidoreductase subunit K n=1 Tax=Coraliomargarita sinensis TaxID=2174842 RepID=A0A317ZGP4_9BACT|nr:NADH-quinone oxidoreductase subunit NuoK [Coraliomargarita sinensis]PXA03403.1 NADH-quinone oxidoreductase subunit NuoK [Coraliomargarita sinensis]
MTVGLNAFILIASLLFAIGMLGVLLRKNTLVIYMSLELMLNAVNLALVAFSRYNGTMDGNLFVFFIITVAAAEVAVGLAIIVALFRRRQTVMVDQLNALSR